MVKGKSVQATKAEQELRIEKVYNMLIDSYSRYSILQFTAKEWKLNTRQSDEYIAKATEKIKEHAKETIEDFTNESKAKFKKLFNIAMKNKDYREARQVIDTMSNVLGYTKLNVEIAGKDGKPIEIIIDKKFEGV
jgi:hypothetical protein